MSEHVLRSFSAARVADICVEARGDAVEAQRRVSQWRVPGQRPSNILLAQLAQISARIEAIDALRVRALHIADFEPTARIGLEPEEFALIEQAWSRQHRFQILPPEVRRARWQARVTSAAAVPTLVVLEGGL
jgi:hypothetical protein